jgi:hypothetical protein
VTLAFPKHATPGARLDISCKNVHNPSPLSWFNNDGCRIFSHNSYPLTKIAIQDYGTDRGVVPLDGGHVPDNTGDCNRCEHHCSDPFLSYQEERHPYFASRINLAAAKACLQIQRAKIDRAGLSRGEYIEISENLSHMNAANVVPRYQSKTGVFRVVYLDGTLCIATLYRDTED